MREKSKRLWIDAFTLKQMRKIDQKIVGRRVYPKANCEKCKKVVGDAFTSKQMWKNRKRFGIELFTLYTAEINRKVSKMWLFIILQKELKICKSVRSIFDRFTL